MIKNKRRLNSRAARGFDFSVYMADTAHLCTERKPLYPKRQHCVIKGWGVYNLPKGEKLPLLLTEGVTA